MVKSGLIRAGKRDFAHRALVIRFFHPAVAFLVPAEKPFGIRGYLPRQQRLYFLPLPQGQGSFRPTFGAVLRTVFGLAD